MLADVLNFVQSNSSTIDNIVTNVTNNGTSATETYFRAMIDKFLESTETNPLLHHSTIVGASAYTGLTRWGRPLSGTAGDFGVLTDMILDPTKVLETIQGASSRANSISGTEAGKQQVHFTQWLRQAMELRDQILASPNIEGIPIQSSKQTTIRSVDISQQQVMVQAGAMGYRKTVSDNAVPLPRRWQIQGYITSVSRVDDMYYHKPTITYQLLFLDECACSHRPVWFKSYEGEYYLVQITSINADRTPDATNASAISLELTEYSPLEVDTSVIPLSAILGELNIE